jgi:hypothetical protein
MGSYKVIYWWSAVLTAISLVFWVVFYRNWVRLGGSQHYVAPVYEDISGELKANAGAAIDGKDHAGNEFSGGRA